MTVGVMCDLAGGTVTVFGNSQRLQLSVTDAYQLLAHMEYVLQQITKDHVMKNRENLIRETYCGE